MRRADIRMAIGQLFDYQRLVGHRVELAVLVPQCPPVDLVELLGSLQIMVVWPTGDTFEERVPLPPRRRRARPDS